MATARIRNDDEKVTLYAEIIASRMSGIKYDFTELIVTLEKMGRSAELMQVLLAKNCLCQAINNLQKAVL